MGCAFADVAGTPFHTEQIACRDWRSLAMSPCQSRVRMNGPAIRRIGFLVAAFLAACEPGIARLDDPYPGWVWDGGLDETDAGADFDAGTDFDAGAGFDAGADFDAGAGSDAGPDSDAGTSPDSGIRLDGGLADAGRPDAGTLPDSGVQLDAGRPDAGPSSARQQPRPLGSTDAGNGFYEYLPPGYPGVERWPLLVFWHGIGENGNGTTELSRVLANGPPRLINQNRWPATRPFVVLSPQHPGGGCPSSTEIQRFIGWAMRTYAIDARTVFLTGLSCGAIGSFSYLTNHLDSQVAAAVLIAGDPGAPTNGGSLWGRHGCDAGVVAMSSFHGSADGTVLPGNDRDTFALLQACPQPPRRDISYVEFPGVGHDSWSRVYDLSAGYDVYAWLLAHPKP